MRLLVLADQPCSALWDNFRPERLAGIDMILSAGDLPNAYLEFLTCFTHAPIVYVPGNHDGHFAENPPGGCICADGKLVIVNGVRILGLGGSMRYSPNGCQYTESEMRRRANRLRWKLWRSGGFDILLTHAPALGLGDGEDICHRGFQTFRDLLDRYQPGLMVYGHMHRTYSITGFQRERLYGQTRLVNAWERYILEFEP